MDVAAIRNLFPITRQGIVYMNTGFSGPSPQAVLDAVTAVMREEMELGPTTAPVMAKSRERRAAGRAQFASMLNATPEETVLTDNTTRGINMVLNGLPWKSGDEIITTSLEHGSGLVPPYQLRERLGVNVVIADLDVQDSPEAIIGKLESAITSKTRLIILSHIMYATGLMVPIAEINRMAHRHGVKVLVDGAQTMGQIAIDVKGWDADYYAVPGHKWMLGPWGMGALYVRNELLGDLVPVEVAGKAAESFDAFGHYEPKRNAPEKFELTTSSNPLLAGAMAAMDLLQSVGMENVQARWGELTERLRQGLNDVPGAAVVSPAAGPTACGLVCFNVAGWEPKELVDTLWDRYKVVIRSVNYPAGVRAAIDFFNTEDEVDYLVDAVGALSKEKNA